MKRDPKYSLFSQAEADLIEPFADEWERLYDKYLLPDHLDKTTPEQDEEFKTFCRNHADCFDSLMPLIDKLKQRYFCIYVTDYSGTILEIVKEDYNPRRITFDEHQKYLASASDNEKHIISDEEYCSRLRGIFNLSADYLYEERLSNIDALRYVHELYQSNKPAPIKVGARRVRKIIYPIDKPNTRIWNMLETTNGQLKFDLSFATEKRGSKKKATVIYSVDFSNITWASTSKKLEPYDKLVYNAIGAHWTAGNEVISLSMIHTAMGYTGTPNSKDIQRLDASVRKMMSTQILINNQDEINSGYNYPSFNYEGSLLPSETISSVINGKVTERAIHLFREPPMISFARERKQVTAFELRVLQSPINKTNQNIAIQDYLIERIARMKTKDSQKRILFSSICKEVDIKSGKPRQRLPETVQRFLDHFKKTGFIKDYTMDKDGVTIQPQTAKKTSDSLSAN